MKQCIALAGLACLLAGGCAQTGLTLGKFNRDQAPAAVAHKAPRPSTSRDAVPLGDSPFAQLASYNSDDGADCGACVEGADCSCAVDGCPVDGCCDPYGGGDPCGAGGACRGLIDGIAGGFCGPGCGLCPHSGGYPEYPMFNQGPPVGQVAYPYYTVRGPRDFLRDNPPTIGPY
jgi:hypothetical protein